MLAHETLLVDSPTEVVPAGTVLLQRSVQPQTVTFVDAGRIGLGILDHTVQEVPGVPLMEHQLGALVGPSWLDATAAVLGLPSAVDAIAETQVSVRRVSLVQFQHAFSDSDKGMQAMVLDIAKAHRQQTDLAVSRLAKDAESRCAEWLLRHAEPADQGGCSVQVHLQTRKRLIAAQLGIAPETLSRVLRHLRERSLISGSGRTVNLVDPSGLRSLAGI
jgi:CRP-like cAMP-binding protein